MFQRKTFVAEFESMHFHSLQTPKMNDRADRVAKERGKGANWPFALDTEMTPRNQDRGNKINEWPGNKNS